MSDRVQKLIKVYIHLIKRIIVSIVKYKHLPHRVLVIGDSHAEVFYEKILQDKFPYIWFDICSVGGATISGLSNPNSQTNSLKKFISFIKAYDKRSLVLVLLGEVDTGFVIWYRAAKRSQSVDEIMNKTLDNYKNFLNNVYDYHHVSVISAPLPTIRDGDRGEVADLRSEVKASLYDRTNLTLKLNDKMEKYCLEKGYYYLSLDKECLGENQLLNDNLRNSNPADHHYDKKKYAVLLYPKLHITFQRFFNIKD